MKRAQGMSINTIILIALGLIILIVLVVIMSGKFQSIGQSLSQCDGTCYRTRSECNSGAPIPTTNCVDNDQGNVQEGAGWCCKAIV